MPEPDLHVDASRRLAELLVVQLWALHVAFHARLEHALAPLGISAAGFRLVGELMRAPEGLRQRELSRRLGVRAPTVSVAVSRLEADGIVRRVEDPADPRAWRVLLAPGAPLGPGVAVLEGLEADLVGSISEAERLHLLSLLARVRAALSPDGAPDDTLP